MSALKNEAGTPKVLRAGDRQAGQQQVLSHQSRLRLMPTAPEAGQRSTTTSADQLLPPDDVLDAALAASAAGPARDRRVAEPRQALALTGADSRCAKILEIGTLGGYSTIWLARALPPGGRLITLEIDPKHADIARSNIERAGLSRMVRARVWAVRPTHCRELAAEGRGPFDLVFIDADKPGNADYFTWALKMSRPGSAHHRRQCGAQRCGDRRVQHRRQRTGHAATQRAVGE